MWEVLHLLRINIFAQLFADTLETQFKGSVRKLYHQVNWPMTFIVQHVGSPLRVLQQKKLLCGVIVLLHLTIKGCLILALRYANSPVAWHEDIKTERNPVQANNLVKVQAGYGEQARRIAFCLSLFNYPCASSPDQLRQEEPHAY